MDTPRLEEVADAEDVQPKATPDAQASLHLADELAAEAAQSPQQQARAAASLRKARDFWLVWSGQSVSMLGDGLYSIALAWWITQELGSATALAGYALCWFIPAVTMPFIAGSLIDRANRKAILLAMDTIQGLVVTLVAYLMWTNTLHQQIWLVYASAVILSACSAIHGPTLDSSIPNLVPEEALARANGLYATSSSVANIAGPLLGGTLVGLVGLPVTMLINAISFWFAAATMVLARVPSPRTTEGSGGSAFSRFLGDAVYGYKWIWSHRAILYLLLIFTAGNFLVAPTGSLQALLIKERLTGANVFLNLDGAQIFGLLAAVESVGALVGALFFSRGYLIKPLAWGVCIGWTFNAIGVIGLGFSNLVPLSAVLVFLIGLSLPVCNIPSQTIWMSYTPDAERGRVFAARRVIAWGIQPISVAFGGLIAEQTGVSALYAAAGILVLLIATGNLLFNRTIRRLYEPDTRPEAANLGLVYRK